MNQYTVLLVDDEEEVRNAIEQRINWSIEYLRKGKRY